MARRDGRTRRCAGALIVGLAVLAVGACGGDADDGPEGAPRPSVGPATPVPGQPPVVWMAGQAEEVDEERVVLVEPGGPRVRLQRLAGGATRFLELRGGAWRRLAEADVELIEVGTPLCVEVFLDGRTYLALRVFVGAACGPST